MKVYIMRHGETVWNAKGIIQGRRQGRLSKTGIGKVEVQAKKFQNVDFGLIFTSPLMRTVQTANIMNKFHSCKVIRDDRLIEVDKGLLAGQRKKLLPAKVYAERYIHPEKYGCEKPKDVCERVRDFVKFLKENFFNKTVLVVTHGAIADLMTNLFKHGSIDESDFCKGWTFKNAEIRFFEI